MQFNYFIDLCLNENLNFSKFKLFLVFCTLSHSGYIEIENVECMIIFSYIQSRQIKVAYATFKKKVLFSFISTI